MNNKTIKLVSLVLIIAVILIFTNSNVYASISPFLDTSQIQAQQDTAADSVQNITGTILAVVQVIGVAVAVIMLIVLAIKYMMSAPNDRAEIKKHAVVYVVGAVVLFASSGILGIIRGFADTLNYSNNGGINARQGVGAEQRLQDLRRMMQETDDEEEKRKMQEEINALEIYLHQPNI